jgi:hypothetical protein
MRNAASLATIVVIGTVLSASANAAYMEATVTGGGVIAGKVQIRSSNPRVERYIISKNPEACGPGYRDVPVVRTAGDALLDAVVYLEDVKRGKPFRAAAKKVTIDQARCFFVPYLSVMANGGELEAVNSDPVLHNIHVYELTGRGRHTVMNVSQPERGNIVAKRILLREGTATKVQCDAHAFMHAYVFVARNPYYAVVDDRGGFRITDVPPGRHTITVWHPFLGRTKETVVVPVNGEVTLDFSY